MNESAAAWRGVVVMEPMLSLFVGTSGPWAWHASVAHKLIVGASGVRGESRQDRRVTFVRAGQAHGAPKQDRVMAMALFDPRVFAERDIDRLAAAWAHLQPTCAAVDAMIEDARRVAGRPVNAKILRGVQMLAGAPRVADAAEAIGLSEGRFSHVVAETLGSPPQKWRGWLRLRQAIDAVSGGASVTAAAHDAGFADASHFSRACVTLLGIRPSIFALPEITLSGAGAGACIDAVAG